MSHTLFHGLLPNFTEIQVKDCASGCRFYSMNAVYTLENQSKETRKILFCFCDNNNCLLYCFMFSKVLNRAFFVPPTVQFPNPVFLEFDVEFLPQEIQDFLSMS